MADPCGKRAHRPRQRQHLRPTFEVDELWLPSAVATAHAFDICRPGELVLRRNEQLCWIALRERCDIAGSLVWSPLPMALHGSVWFGSNCLSGELFFVSKGQVRAFDGGGERHVLDLEKVVADGPCSLMMLPPPSSGFGCYDASTGQLWFFTCDGGPLGGPFTLPHEAARKTLYAFMHPEFYSNGGGEADYEHCHFVAEPAPPGAPLPARLFFNTEKAVYSWILAEDRVECLAGHEDSIGKPAEGFGTAARCGLMWDCCIEWMAGFLYIHPVADEGELAELQLLQLDLRTRQVRFVDFVNARGDAVASALASMKNRLLDVAGDRLLLWGDSEKNHTPMVVDMSADLLAPKLALDMACVDWTGPARMLRFELGEGSGEAFEVDCRILTARCSHFARVLSSGMSESQEGAPIRLEDVPPAALHHFMHYLHTDDFDPMGDVADAGEHAKLLECGRLCLAVHRLADRYGMLRLRKLACVELHAALDAGTALELLEEAVGDRIWDHDCDEVATVCWEACQRFWPQIVEGHDNQIEAFVCRRPALTARLLRSIGRGSYLGSPAVSSPAGSPRGATVVASNFCR